MSWQNEGIQYMQHIQNQSMDLLGQFFSAGVNDAAFYAFQKEVQKTMIKTIYAPTFLVRRNLIVQAILNELKASAQTTKQSLETISQQIDHSIEGQASKKIQQHIQEHAKQYDVI